MQGTFFYPLNHCSNPLSPHFCWGRSGVKKEYRGGQAVAL